MSNEDHNTLHMAVFSKFDVNHAILRRKSRSIADIYPIHQAFLLAHVDVGIAPESSMGAIFLDYIPSSKSPPCISSTFVVERRSPCHFADLVLFLQSNVPVSEQFTELEMLRTRVSSSNGCLMIAERVGYKFRDGGDLAESVSLFQGALRGHCQRMCSFAGTLSWTPVPFAVRLRCVLLRLRRLVTTSASLAGAWTTFRLRLRHGSWATVPGRRWRSLTLPRRVLPAP
jgi:hypothetical protein